MLLIIYGLIVYILIILCLTICVKRLVAPSTSLIKEHYVAQTRKVVRICGLPDTLGMQADPLLESEQGVDGREPERLEQLNLVRREKRKS